jgi:cytoskeletal protein RodZ
MSKLYTSGIAVALGFLGVALAQAQQPPPSPQPSTSETEGTAADRTKPGETPTQNAPSPTENPRPSTSETEGTAADRTPPGKTPTMQQSEIVGAAVVTPADAPLGKVVDVVFDAKNQPAFVVIASEGKAVAMPYSVASSMMNANKIVIDRPRLQAAPKIKQGEWRNESSSTWKNESARYWDHRG